MVLRKSLSANLLNMLRQVLSGNQQGKTDALNAWKLLVNLLAFGELAPILAADVAQILEKCRSATQDLLVSAKAIQNLAPDIVGDESEFPFCRNIDLRLRVTGNQRGADQSRQQQDARLQCGVSDQPLGQFL